ncbi:MAG: cysteine--tRNA ligase [Lachnospiraceae bacterium]|uniref:Cysteine--tRNA ligase n=1 Tax=Candidatus Weimeria bifida TaxID=2599074 RepID=A0A6N7IZ14_9FIRM|nr:cysteine--tRNA ligase [Candidatus Weimeria bifida]RRF97062.1 MAG: cysteine--tRNA ligase [Lachnospiraceae bacterium]
MLKIYNTLTRKKEEFKPIEEGRVRMYVCGPTVYNYIHIGNARPMIVFDTVRRYFLYKGYNVDYVSNFTDVDDKIINEAIKEGKSASEVAEFYIKECKKDMKSMNIMPATVNPRATEEIDGMIDMISNLIDKDYAYVASDGTVYYRTRRFAGYGKLSHKNIDDLEAGHRDIKVTGDEKQDPLDFVLWKPKKEGEPSWRSPWCDGRPGWHIECSVMSKRYLGNTIDIHAGGEDLIFPHHENEIAQSEAANGVPFAHYWMHNGFLNINNVKMSKSLGNFLLVRDILKKYNGDVLRFFMLSAQYRSPLNYSAELMESAKNGLDRIRTCGDRLKDLISKSTNMEMTEEEDELLDTTKQYVENFEKAMDDDFNTADAIAAIFDLVKFANTNLDEESSGDILMKVFEKIEKLLGVLGLAFTVDKDEIDPEVEELIEKRQQARKEKNFALADQIRDQLLSQGIELKDTRDGVKWKRV